MTTPSITARKPEAAQHPRSRLRARLVLAGFAAVGLAALAWAAFVQPLPRLIYNPSDSVPVGWYRVDPQTLQREVEQERWTSLDRTLQRQTGEDGRVQIERFNEPRLQRQRLLLIGRLQRLQHLGLADEMQPGTWAVHADAEKTLRALGERGDIIRTLQRAMRGEPRELSVFESGGRGAHGELDAESDTTQGAPRPEPAAH